MNRDATYCFIVNELSGRQVNRRNLDDFQKHVHAVLPAAHFVIVQPDESIVEVARKQSTSYSHIIACGGDGTVNRVANGIMGTEAVIGIIPMGSGNDIARQLGIPTNVNRALEVLLQDKRLAMDVIKTEWGYFLNTYGIGADGLTNYYATQSSLKTGGMRYFFGGLKALLIAQPFEATLEFKRPAKPKKERTWMITAANGTTEGGQYTISPNSKIDDGVFELLVVKDVSRVRLMLEFVKLSLGLPFSPKVAQFYTVDSSCSVTLTKTLKVHADGEQIPPKKAHSFKILMQNRPVICDI